VGCWALIVAAAINATAIDKPKGLSPRGTVNLMWRRTFRFIGKLSGMTTV
jgi:hypothetical protein